ncbi:GTP cyclohydrolase II [Stakelama pacifica]|uniref:GTP cyclohydrolase-2 n=1 Tax=Stakelama pacifica TaxID=517720 RepID=A0A4R6FBA4_9SPHN|nr:GTP cyclohydrolase II [Stakelama pacifica]TDN78406.1 GTP cyclohydrolase II [Stakelama pacifica]GGO99526.1 GTP cyclohydrolase-2 [Stakelama pacifica]
MSAAPDPRAAARAVDSLRRGWPVTIGSGDAALSAYAVETGDAGGLQAFDPDGGASLLLSAGRAATLKLTNQAAAATPDGPVQIARALWLDFDLATALANPRLDLQTPLKGPFRAEPVTEPDLAATLLQLARVAGLLPAFFVLPGGKPDFTPDDLTALEAPANLRIAARARLPVSAAEDSEIIAFRGPGGDEHVALIIGQPDGNPPLVRLHSECLTGDVLGSLKCDCGPQLHAAIHAMSDAGWGILLYLRQEGRGIGLINKLRAYSLQDQGFDTVDANTRLGFAIDARDFGIAARMLELIGQRRIRLLTNNPAKVDTLRAQGVDVVERIAHQLPPNPYNERYLATKRDRTGHQL